MYCSELDRLLTEHSALTMELFRQEGRTEGWYRTVEEWERECRQLQAIERQLARLTHDVATHRRRHGCCGAAPDACSPVALDRELTTEDTEDCVSGHDLSRAENVSGHDFNRAENVSEHDFSRAENVSGHDFSRAERLPMNVSS